MSDEFLSLLAESDQQRHLRAELLLDTNVAAEIYSFGDLFRTGDRFDTSEAALASSTYRYRQLRARHSIILGWWLAQTGTVAACHGNELVDIITTQLAPATDGTAFTITAGIVRVVMPRVLHGLRLGALTEVDHAAAGTDADTELLRLAKRDRLPLITNEGLTEAGVRDRGLRRRCIEESVEVLTPEQFLHTRHVDVAGACRDFCAACAVAVREAGYAPLGPGADATSWREMLEDLVALYRYVLLDEVDERFANVRGRGCSAREAKSGGSLKLVSVRAERARTRQASVATMGS